MQTFFKHLTEEPALLELLVLIFAIALLWLLSWRLGRLVRDARSRAALEDFLLGAEQALAGDVKGASKRLQKVIREEPANQAARLLYGQVLAELGEPAKAHKLHLELQRAFHMQSPRNDLSCAQALLAAGHPAEALQPAESAYQALPKDLDACRALYQVHMALGNFLQAGRTGSRLQLLLGPGEERQQVQQAAAAALVQAGQQELRQQQPQKAAALAVEARALVGDSHPVKLLQASLPTAGSSTEVTVRKQDADLHSLLAQGDYCCRQCTAPLSAPERQCPHCGAEDSAQLLEPQLHTELDSPALAMDEIDANLAHLRRLISAFMEADEQARQALLQMGPEAVEELLATALRRPPQASAIVELLQQMGAPILPTLFQAYRNLKEKSLLSMVGLRPFRSPVDVVRQVVLGLGKPAQTYLAKLMDSEDRDLRKVIIDCYMGLGMQDEFQLVLDHFPPLEIIHRMNEAESSLLQPLLHSTQRGSFLAEGLLTNAAFHRDMDMLDAIPESNDPSVLEQVLARRGYNREITEALIPALGDPALREAAGRLLDGFGMVVMEHLIAEFANLDHSQEVRQQLAQRICRSGVTVVERICEGFGPSPSNLDAELQGLLIGIGEAGIPALAEAYQRGGLLEKLAGSLMRRYTHRRSMILRALAGIGTVTAVQQLTRLQDQEVDPDLQLRIAQALHTMQDAGDDSSRPDQESSNKEDSNKEDSGETG